MIDEGFRLFLQLKVSLIFILLVPTLRADHVPLKNYSPLGFSYQGTSKGNMYQISGKGAERGNFFTGNVDEKCKAIPTEEEIAEEQAETIKKENWRLLRSSIQQKAHANWSSRKMSVNWLIQDSSRKTVDDKKVDNEKVLDRNAQESSASDAINKNRNASTIAFRACNKIEKIEAPEQTGSSELKNTKRSK